MLFIARDKNEKALEVLDRCEKELPSYNIPYDYTSTTMALLYFDLGEREKAIDILTAVADNNIQYLSWGASLSKEYQSAVKQTLNQNMAMLGYILQQLDHYKKEDLFEKYYTEYATISTALSLR